MIGNTGDTQPIKVPGLPLYIRFRGKPDDLKKSSLAILQDAQKDFANGEIDAHFEQPAELATQKTESSEVVQAEQHAEANSEEDLLVVRPRSAERRAEDFMRDWMRHFTRS